MTPEKEQVMNQHIQAIAKILYEDTQPEKLTTLAGIEKAVRQQMMTQVMPKIGVFLSNQQQTLLPDVPASSKVF